MRKIVVTLVSTGVLVAAAAPTASAAPTGMPDPVQERICGKFSEKPVQSKGILRVEQTLDCSGGLPT